MGVPLGILSWEVLVRSPKCNRKDLYAICSYPSLKKVGYVPLYTFRKSLLDIQRLGLWNHLAQHISQTRFTLCRFTWSGFGFHLITAVSVIKKLIWIYSLSGAEILCPLSILERVCVIEVFFKENIKWEFFSGHWKLSVMERCPHREVRFYHLKSIPVFRPGLYN